MSQMPEKIAKPLSLNSWIFSPSKFMIHWWFKILTLSIFIGILVVWGFDSWSISGLHKDFFTVKQITPVILTDSNEHFSPYTAPVQPNLTFHEKPHRNLTHTFQNLTQTHESLSDLTLNQPNLTNFSSQNQLNVTSLSSQILENVTNPSAPTTLGWISAEFEANFSSKLLAGWLAPGGEPCKDSKTVDISIPKLDGQEQIYLSTGDIHEFVFQALDESGKPHCLGGDYFETDLSGESWKSRPPIKDFGNGTYSFSVQVHPDFTGNYNLTVILLFRHFEGLKFSPERFAFDKILRTIPINFYRSSTQVPQLTQCHKSELNRDVWSGRWTRHGKNESCEISNDGRYRCFKSTLPCQHPWCDGSLGLLESNGWTYSTHCSFKIFSSKKAWNCLNNRWIFFWGDSNHCDTIRNIIHFILNVPEIKTVPRWFDMNITNPKQPSQTVRITSIFNGHSIQTGNYQGLNSLKNETYREILKEYFSHDNVPDTLVMNSGLHDGVFWSNLRRFNKGAEQAAEFWAEVMESVRRRGLVAPEVLYRTTVATGGYARRLAFNPHKMEAFNGVFLEKLKQFGVVNRVIDHFDMTFPWHFDNRCNDGVHYGRAPAKMKWRDGEIGHQYFVDLMLGHVLLNALCAR
ncbi:uncharacterized protein LOC132275164 [Cornus florida]|uniref:uncharacterized protein LOC132275164 n=1 Tax=Cornus florida TaxID=4283 RepID=UPI00289DD3CF|nr:uncharacterized protein LOC132275164 [Cornus florida]